MLTPNMIFRLDITTRINKNHDTLIIICLFAIVNNISYFFHYLGAME